MYEENYPSDKTIIRQGDKVDWDNVEEKFKDVIKKIINAAKYIFSEDGGACDETRKDEVLDKWEKTNKKIIENEKKKPKDDILDDADNVPDTKDDDEDISIIHKIPDSPDLNDETNEMKPEYDVSDDYELNFPKEDKKIIKKKIEVKYDPYGLNNPKKKGHNKDVPNKYANYYEQYYKQYFGQEYDCPYADQYRLLRATKVCKKNEAKRLKFRNAANVALKQKKLRAAKKLKAKTAKI